MAYVNHEIGFLVRCRPEEAKVRILESYQRALGFNQDAAAHLDASVTTLKRWVKALGIVDDVDKLRKRVGHGDSNALARKRKAERGYGSAQTEERRKPTPRTGPRRKPR